MQQTERNDGDAAESSKSNKTLSYKSKCLKNGIENLFIFPYHFTYGWVGAFCFVIAF